MEFFGLVDSIKATIGIIVSLIECIETWNNQDKDERDLRLRFGFDSIALQELLAMLKNTTPVAPRNVSEEERLFCDMATHLETLRCCLATRLAKMRGGPSDSDIWEDTTSSARSIAARAAWVFWRRRDLEKLEASLHNWIQRLQVITSAVRGRSLGAGDVSEITATMAALPGLETLNRIGLKIRDYSSLAARKVNEDTLLKPFQTIKVLERQSRRNAAEYYTPDTGAGNGGEQARPSQSAVIEYTARAYTENDSSETVQQIGDATRDLVKILFHSDPDRTGILRCIGYTHNEAIRSFGLVYDLPPDARLVSTTTPDSTEEIFTGAAWRVQSLRDLYLCRPAFSLTERLTLCCDVAKAVLYVHLLGWVHKSVRPDNIIFFSKCEQLDPGPDAVAGVISGSTSEKKRQILTGLPRCYLAGFEYSRSAKEASDRRDDGDWQHNVYRHPQRQGVKNNSGYTMAHDIYSLGVVCLEVGMWGHGGTTRVPYGDRSQFKGLKPGAVMDELLRIMDSGHEDSAGGNPLAKFMGDKFAAVVRYCLTVDTTDDVSSTKYIQEVWLKLDEIRCAL